MNGVTGPFTNTSFINGIFFVPFGIKIIQDGS